MYYSQCGEDRFIIENAKLFGHNFKTGTFIEVGAADGIEFSNTAYFEKTLGWKGLVIEPNPKMEESIRKNRSCAIEMCAISLMEGGQMFTVTDDHLLSGFKRTEGEQVIVPTMRLDTLIRKHFDIFRSAAHPAFPMIDLLSIDTEGTEIDVLESLGRERWHVNILIVEFDTQGLGSQKDQILEYTNRAGFELIHTMPWNLILQNKCFREA